MRDEEGGAVTQQRGQAGLHETFGLGVNAGGGFVEDEQARVGEQGPHEAEQLALAMAEQAPTLAYIGIIAVGQAHDEIVRPNGLRRGYDDRLADSGIAIAQIVAHGAAEEKRLLQDKTNLLPQILLGEPADINAIDQ